MPTCLMPATDLTVYVVGIARAARVLPEIPYDPAGAKLRA